MTGARATASPMSMAEMRQSAGSGAHRAGGSADAPAYRAPRNGLTCGKTPAARPKRPKYSLRIRGWTRAPAANSAQRAWTHFARVTETPRVQARTDSL